MAGVRPGDLRVGLADPDDVREPAVPLPPGALPPGPLRVTADFAVVVGPTTAVAEPLPATAARLRAALAEAAAARLGLTAADVDLRVTGLLDETPEAGPEAGPGPGPVDAADTDTDTGDGGSDDGSEASGDEGRVARAALTVPGVARLTGVLGRPVHLTEPPPREVPCRAATSGWSWRCGRTTGPSRWPGGSARRCPRRWRTARRWRWW